jgi:chromosome segregation ATPase
MQELGYLGAAAGESRGKGAAAAPYEAEWDHLARLARSLIGQRDSLADAAREKNAEIAALATANADYRRQLQEKEAEIADLAAAYAAYRQHLEEKEQEIHMLSRAAAARQTIIEQLQASREYKAGVTLLHPWRVLREKLGPAGDPPSSSR